MAIEYTKTFSVTIGALGWNNVTIGSIAQPGDPSNTTYIVKYLVVSATAGFTNVNADINGGAVYASFQNSGLTSQLPGPLVSFNTTDYPALAPLEMINSYTAPFSSINVDGTDSISKQVTIGGSSSASGFTTLVLTTSANAGSLLVTVSVIKILPTAVEPYSMFSVSGVLDQAASSTGVVLVGPATGSYIVKDICLSNTTPELGDDIQGWLTLNSSGISVAYIMPLTTFNPASGRCVSWPIYLSNGYTIVLHTGTAGGGASGVISATASYEISP
jgi:hypothetical protein